MTTVGCCPPQDHDALVRAREDLEQRLSEQKEALEEQKKRYDEMEVHSFHLPQSLLSDCMSTYCRFGTRKRLNRSDRLVTMP